MPASPSCDIAINGTSLTALQEGGLLWAKTGTLIVSDLHLEKGSSFARTGQMLPPYDSRATLTRLSNLIAQHAPSRVICLGDSFHDASAAGRMLPEDRAELVRMTRQADWIWITGNHDPNPPADIGGEIFHEWTEGPLVFRHESALERGAGEISGHYHPKASLQTRIRRLSAPCFVEDGSRLIMPAFGSFTGGLSVSDPAIGSFFPRGFVAHLATKYGMLSVPRARLLKAA